MASDADSFHEDPAQLSRATIEMHRALRSLIEELEAIDWYAQRIDAGHDEELAAVLAHNLDEEREHACMTLEWIRRRDARFDAHLRRYLFRPATRPIIETTDHEAPDHAAPSALRIGSLREEPAP